MILTLVAVLCVAGVRSIVARRTTTVRVVRSVAPSYDVGAAAFAQSFARVYLSWASGDNSARQTQLKPFLDQALDGDGGVQPAAHSFETVSATEVAGESRAGDVTNVIVIAQTSAGTRYLSVPVTRGDRGMLSIAAYPAFVGPPASDPESSRPPLPTVESQSLQTVLSRALGNYLDGQSANLRADLTSTAVVSLPAQALTLKQVDSDGWLVPSHTVAVQVLASDPEGDSFTLTYQVGVVMQDRWYVQSIQFDPTLQGGA